MDRRYLLVIPALLGIAFVLNPLYFYPDGGEDRWTHETTEIDLENETQTVRTILDLNNVANCPGVRSCPMEAQIRDSGPVAALSMERPAIRSDWKLEGRYPVVTFLTGNGTQAYVTDRETIDGVPKLTLTAVDHAEAIERAAIPSREVHSKVSDAIETGSATTTGDRIEPFYDYVFEHDGRYYKGSRVSRNEPDFTRTGIVVTRTVLYVVGVGLLLYTGWALRARDGTEAG